MSSSADSGHYAHLAYLKNKEKCMKSPNDKHKWEVTCGSWPSVEQTCKYCKQKIYSK